MIFPSSPKAAAGEDLAAAFAEHAHRYSTLRWALIRVNGKEPRDKKWEQAKPSEPGFAAGEWAHFRCNMGTVLGPSGLAVFEYDDEQAQPLFLELLGGTLPATPLCRTGSGKLHAYFLDPGGLDKKARDGLELRVGNHQCLLPPSVHPDSGQPYTWVEGHEPWSTPLLALPETVIAFFAATSARHNGAEPVAEIIPERRRHSELLSLAGTMRRRGMDAEEILAAITVVNERRCSPPLPTSELESLAADVNERWQPDPENSIRVTTPAEPRPIDDVLEVFNRWMHLPDPGPVYVTCATIAANRVDSFDPTWLILVGAAGSGKTEALSATSRLDDVHVVATLTEASLLSGTPRKDTAAGASGGLLREIGENGIIVLKDFGSILSMHRDARSAVLAALRELFDGNWTRLVGVDGGRRLHWEGRVGLLAGATTVLDQHHAVMAQLGERFLIHRVAVDDASAQGHSSLAHHGRERGMRRELAEAVAGLFAGLDLTEPPPLSNTDTQRLVSLAVLVAQARSPVVRDSYRREIELVPDSEAPGRIVGALARLLTGLRLIGVSEAESWRLTVKTGLDSMPAARRRALEFLLDQPSAATTTDVATTLGLPNPTAHRVLEDLAAHAVVQRESQGAGKPDLWEIKPETVDLYRAATSSEMSDVPIS